MKADLSSGADRECLVESAVAAFGGPTDILVNNAAVTLFIPIKTRLVKLGHVAIDGTKLKANASKHKAMSYGHMRRQEPGSTPGATAIASAQHHTFLTTRNDARGTSV
jgi:hypothetical protein